MAKKKPNIDPAVRFACMLAGWGDPCRPETPEQTQRRWRTENTCLALFIVFGVAMIAVCLWLPCLGQQ